MKIAKNRKTGLLVALAVILLLGNACKRSVALLDSRDRGRPVMQRALVRLNNGDIKGAVELYHTALDNDPKLAKAHLDLALLLHDHEQDYVGAIYHYRTYLRMRPETEKKNLVEERLRLATQLFAATMNPSVSEPTAVAAPPRELVAPPPPSGPSPEIKRKIDKLENEKREAKEALQEALSHIRRLEGQMSRMKGDLLLARARPDTASKPPSNPTEDGQEVIRTYRVKRGDTLSSIALDVYGEVTRWEKIYSANKGELKNGTRLQVGQVLVIP